VYCKVRAEEAHDNIVMQAPAKGNTLRGTSRIVTVDKHTVCD
jgi:hypothetical protein